MGGRKGGKKKSSRKRKANVWDDAEPKSKGSPVNRDDGASKRKHGSMMGQWKSRKIAASTKTREFVRTVYDKKQWQCEQYNRTWEHTVNAIYKDKSVHDEQNVVKEEILREESTSEETGSEESDSEEHKSVFQEFVDTFKPIEIDADDEGEVLEKSTTIDKVEKIQEEEQVAAMEKDDEKGVDEQEEEAEDPYRQRFVLSSVSEEEVKTFTTKTRTFTPVTLPELEEVYDVSYKSGIHGRTDVVTLPEIADKKKLFVRSRLATTWRERKLDADTVFPKGSIQRTLLQQLFAYTDVFFAGQTYENTDLLRRMSAMHVLNHVLKARDTVLRNNERLKKRELNDLEDDDKEYRDQGFCRASVLVLLPLRSAAVAFVNHLLTLLPLTVTTFYNKERFVHEFGDIPSTEIASQDSEKKEWQRVFAMGNNDDCFQTGLSFSRKAVRFYSDYRHADIIIASPLGLRQQLGDEAALLDDVKNLSSDFLSSIEICIVDSASLMMMQNLDHVRTVLRATNVPPKEAHDADFSRLRAWHLTFLARSYRQTIVFAHNVEPALNALVAKTCTNLSGAVKFVRRYATVDGTASIARVVPQVNQLFQRVDCTHHERYTALDDVECRFAFFKKHVFEPLLASPRKHVLLFIPSYFDYVRVRNLFHETMNKKLIRSVQCCEYTTNSQVSRARTTFFHGHCHVLLYTERFHFYHQYQIRGVHHIIWYGLPSFSDFYPEMMNMLASYEDQATDTSEGKTSIALFSRLDLLRMQRIVGNKRAERMCRAKAAKPTYLFR